MPRIAAMKAPRAKTSACALCGRPARAAATAATGGAKLAFCCRGCAEVYTLFARRGWSAALEAAPAAPPPPEAKLENARYLVRGLWCPSCAWGLERYLRRCPGVVSARVDYLDARCELQIAAGAGDARRWIAALGFEAVAEGAAWDASGGLALRAGLALFIGMGVMTLSWSGYAPALLSGGSAAAAGPSVDLAAGAGAALIVFGCGWPILRGGWLGLRRGAATMDTLIAASGLAAFGLSVFEWAQARVAYFDVPAMLFAFLLAGRWLEQRARLRAQRDLARWQPPPALAWRAARGLSFEPVAASELAAADCILLRPADRVPADCRLVAGAVMADESLLTGEARPLRREAGATLFAGALITGIVGPEPATAEVLRPAAESRLAEIAAQVERTRRARSGSRQARRLDRWAAYFVPIVAGLALLTLALNYRFGAGAAAAWLRAISVLILACPCTLGLALPLVEERAVALAARRGILIQDLDALPALLACDMVVLDKTGTVTAGAAAVTTFACAAAGSRVAAAAGAAGGAGDATVARSEESGEQALLGAAAALEADTLHPLGEAIRDFSARRLAAGGGDGSARWASIETVAGQGVRGRAAEGSEWRIGRAEFAAPRGLPPELARLAASARAAGDSVAILGREGEALALFALRDRVRAGARAAIRGWQRRREVLLVSGDDPAAVAAAARHLDIAQARGAQSPEQKAALVAALRGRGRRVAMIGDGHNDALALAAATTGIALARGALLPCRAAAITLLQTDFDLLERVFALAGELRRRERIGLLWAALYNAIGLPLAAAGVIGPLAAALAMVASSFSLLAVALRPFRALRGEGEFRPEEM